MNKERVKRIFKSTAFLTEKPRENKSLCLNLIKSFSKDWVDKRFKYFCIVIIPLLGHSEFRTTPMSPLTICGFNYYDYFLLHFKTYLTRLS